MSPSLQSQGLTNSNGPSLLGGPGRDYQHPHHAPRIPFSPHPNVHDPSSRPTFAQPRAIENPVTSMSSPNTMYSHPNNAMMLDAAVRPDQSGAGAPPFENTQILHPIYSSSRAQVEPDINAKIHKGFFQVDHKWTCYRRNYFSVQCSFSLRGVQGNSQLYLQRSNGMECIESFAITISAVVGGDGGDARQLIQHTPKRSKETEEPPKKVRINPTLAGLGLNQNPTPTSMPFSFAGISQQNGMKQDYETAYGSSNPASHSSTSHTFERIQFQRATANNGKRRAQQQYYHVVVELYAEVGRGPDKPWGSLVKIATKMSAPMVVRGRSPGHYKDGRRDSSTSGMGGDGPAGSGDGGGSILPPPMSGPGSVNRYPIVSDQRSHMGRGDYRTMAGMTFETSPDHSSPSPGLEQDGLEEDDGAAMDTSEVDKYIHHDYPATSEVDLQSSTSPANSYRIQLPAVDFAKPRIDSFNEANTNFNTFFSQSARNQTPRPVEQYSRADYGHSSDRYSHTPWLTNSYHRDPIAAGSVGWSGNS
jgi:meiosis-specific transcription factor NDT80